MALLQINRRTFRFFLLLVVFSFFVYYLFFSNFGYIKKWQLEKEKKVLLKQIEEEFKRRDSLENRILLLENDSIEIEKVAREKYGLVREGEEIYAITKKKTK